MALNSPDFRGSIDSQRCFGKIGAAASARTGKDGFGAVSLMVRPSVPFSVIDSTGRSGVRNAARVVFRMYSYENFTSAFVSGWPSCHFSPERRVMS